MAQVILFHVGPYMLLSSIILFTSEVEWYRNLGVFSPLNNTDTRCKLIYYLKCLQPSTLYQHGLTAEQDICPSCGQINPFDSSWDSWHIVRDWDHENQYDHRWLLQEIEWYIFIGQIFWLAIFSNVITIYLVKMLINFNIIFSTLFILLFTFLYLYSLF